MTHQISPTSHGDKPSSGVFPLAFHSAWKTSPNLHYGKYTQQYQYVTPFLPKCHGRLRPRFDRSAPTDNHRQASSASRNLDTRIANEETLGLSACETLLRNGLVLQQGFAC